MFYLYLFTMNILLFTQLKSKSTCMQALEQFLCYGKSVIACKNNCVKNQSTDDGGKSDLVSYFSFTYIVIN
jgi:hypothetical protein